jgi:gas vesicle protein
MNVVVAEKQREICRELKNLVAKIEDNIKQEEERIQLEIEQMERPAELKNLVAKIEDNIKQEEERIQLEIEQMERPAAGIRQSRPNSAHNHWIGGLRTNGWIRNHNY